MNAINTPSADEHLSVSNLTSKDLSANDLSENRLSTRHPVAIPQISSEDLMKNCKEIQIVHKQQIYRLRETQAGKLILTK